MLAQKFTGITRALNEFTRKCIPRGTDEQKHMPFALSEFFRIKCPLVKKER